MPKYEAIVLGGGGHAKAVVHAIARNISRPPAIVACVGPDAPSWEIDYLGPEIPDDLRHLPVINGIGSAGGTARRRLVYLREKERGASFCSVTHATAIIHTTARIGEGSQFMAGCIVQNHVTIGANVLINTGAIVDHDCTIGSHCHIATGARLCGTVTLGDGVHVGAGASIKQGITIGENAVVGLGAVVIRDVPAGVTVVGSPANGSP